MKVCTVHHIIAYVAAAVAVVSVILAGISRLILQTLWLGRESYITIAVVALLFAIYFLIDGVLYAAKKAK